MLVHMNQLTSSLIIIRNLIYFRHVILLYFFMDFITLYIFSLKLPPWSRNFPPSQTFSSSAYSVHLHSSCSIDSSLPHTSVSSSSAQSFVILFILLQFIPLFYIKMLTQLFSYNLLCFFVYWHISVALFSYYSTFSHLLSWYVIIWQTFCFSPVSFCTF